MFTTEQLKLADIQAVLGIYYLNGLCVERNYDEAFRWFSMAASQGQSQAQISLGTMYQEALDIIVK